MTMAAIGLHGSVHNSKTAAMDTTITQPTFLALPERKKTCTRW
jgi:hypothetical protein